MSDTLYQVSKGGRAICTGNLKQCVLWLFNVIPLETTIGELRDNVICIEPLQKVEIIA